MTRRTLSLLLVASALVAIPRLVVAEPPPLIPRDVLFGNPDKASPQLSPDGTRLAWLAADNKGVLQVWVKTIGKDDDRVVTDDKQRGIRNYFWAEDDRTLLYLQDVGGDENFHVFGVDLESGNVRDLTPWQGVRAEVLGTSTEAKLRETILVGMNVRNRQVMDVYRVNLKTGAVELDTENPGDAAAWIADDKLVVRGMQVIKPDGGGEIRVRDNAKGKWRVLLVHGPEEQVSLISFSKDGRSAVMQTTIDSDTARVVTRDLKSGKEKLIAKSDVVDAGEVIIHPTKLHVQAVAFRTGRNEWTIVDPAIKDDFAAIAKLGDGDMELVSRDRDDKHWLVALMNDDGPVRWYAWDRAARKETFLFTNFAKLEGLKLAEIQPMKYQARDGLTIHGYLTLPPGLPAKKLPLVLLVHGGPWARDRWGWSPTVQWLANRGYAVLQVNFRGSTGYGKKFLHAGDKQWGLAMQDDLTDAVDWAVKAGYADAKKVVIFGGSYGGYAALAGAAFTPNLYKAAIDVVGPSNLFTLLESIPPYWAPLKAMFYARMGNPETEKDLLTKASPLFSADKIRIPLLIGQGANDPRVKQAESEQIVAAIEKTGGQAIYVLYSDEGHGFRRPENSIDFNARVETFLGEQLGGRVEKLKGDKVKGSTAVVKIIGAKKAAKK